MLDINYIRQNRKKVEEGIRAKEGEVDLTELLRLDEELRTAITKGDQLKAARNDYSKKIGELKRAGGDATDAMEKVEAISYESHELDKRITELEQQFTRALSYLPNLPMEDVPVDLDKANNVCIKAVGSRPQFDFQPKNHLELNEKLEVLDFKRGAKLSGAGFPVYKGWGARLEWALINYMLETHLNNGYEMWMVPHLVKPDTLFASGQLPKFENQQFQIRDEDFSLALIPTAEIALNGLHIDEIFAEEELPKRYVSYTPCFRREAGAAGKNERGLIRVHQFNKVEMFCFTKPEESRQMFEEMLASADQVLEGLGLHYRNMLLVTGDMSYGAAKTVDVEVWLPGQDRYYEVSSVSNCTDYQARRSKTRYREKGGKPQLVHTLNGSGTATARLLVAILENNQQADGSVIIPEVLRKYLGGKERLIPGEIHEHRAVSTAH
jgi:seryl-tRNA synthetase